MSVVAARAPSGDRHLVVRAHPAFADRTAARIEHFVADVAVTDASTTIIAVVVATGTAELLQRRFPTIAAGLTPPQLFLASRWVGLHVHPERPPDLVTVTVSGAAARMGIHHLYVAPEWVHPSAAPVYERLRADGMSPVDASLAAELL